MELAAAPIETGSVVINHPSPVALVVPLSPQEDRFLRLCQLLI
jgi:hypothetical protein